MTDTAQKANPSAVGIALLQQLLASLESKGTITIDDIGNILSATSSSLPMESPDFQVLKKEIEKMASHINVAKQEVLSIALAPKEAESEDEEEPQAIEQLSEVVKHTEEATNKIMDAADAISDAAANIADANIAQTINDQTMAIYDACSFQDISGQRINKVIQMVEDTEYRIVQLIKLFNGDIPEGFKEVEKVERVERADEALMMGPQLAEDRPSQDDIDAMFD